jgi:xylitol oxidase
MSTNWAGNVQYPESQPVATPLSFESLQETVRGATTVRPVGTGHSFVPCMTVGDVGGGSEVMLSLMQMPRVFDLDVDAKTVTIDGGMTYTELAGRLRGTGLTLANTQSLPHITVAGAVSTGTHGSSGVCGTHGRASLGSQSVQVAALEVLNPEGDPVWFRRGEPGFNGAVISFGCLGPMTKVGYPGSSYHVWLLCLALDKLYHQAWLRWLVANVVKATE